MHTFKPKKRKDVNKKLNFKHCNQMKHWKQSNYEEYLKFASSVILQRATRGTQTKFLLDRASAAIFWTEKGIDFFSCTRSMVDLFFITFRETARRTLQTCSQQWMQVLDEVYCMSQFVFCKLFFSLLVPWSNVHWSQWILKGRLYFSILILMAQSFVCYIRQPVSTFDRP